MKTDGAKGVHVAKWLDSLMLLESKPTINIEGLVGYAPLLYPIKWIRAESDLNTEATLLVLF